MDIGGKYKLIIQYYNILLKIDRILDISSLLVASHMWSFESGPQRVPCDSEHSNWLFSDKQKRYDKRNIMA